MANHKVRIMIIQDLETKKEVYGQMIYDEYLNEGDPVVSTNDVVETYLSEFCSGCYVKKNYTHPLSDDFQGRAALVAESAGMKEYAVMVKILTRPVDTSQVIAYHEKNFNQWNAALELSRGNPDPRVLDEPEPTSRAKEWWAIFGRVFGCICFAMIIGMFVNKVLSDDHNRSE